MQPIINFNFFQRISEEFEAKKTNSDESDSTSCPSAAELAKYDLSATPSVRSRAFSAKNTCSSNSDTPSAATSSQLPRHLQREPIRSKQSAAGVLKNSDEPRRLFRTTNKLPHLNPKQTIMSTTSSSRRQTGGFHAMTSLARNGADRNDFKMQRYFISMPDSSGSDEDDDVSSDDTSDSDA